MFKTTDLGLKTRLWLNSFKIPSVLGVGKYILFADHELEIYSVVGKYVELPEIAKPTKEDVDKWHKVYCDEVVRVYEKYKHLNGGCPLEIW